MGDWGKNECPTDEWVPQYEDNQYDNSEFARWLGSLYIHMKRALHMHYNDCCHGESARVALTPLCTSKDAPSTSPISQAESFGGCPCLPLFEKAYVPILILGR